MEVAGEESGDGLLIVNSFNKRLIVRVEGTFPCESISIHRAPRKVCFFVWLMAMDVILTAENLRKKKITHVGASCVKVTAEV